MHGKMFRHSLFNRLFIFFLFIRKKYRNSYLSVIVFRRFSHLMLFRGLAQLLNIYFYIGKGYISILIMKVISIKGRGNP